MGARKLESCDKATRCVIVQSNCTESMSWFETSSITLLAAVVLQGRECQGKVVVSYSLNGKLESLNA